jgi:membrane protein
LKLRELKQWVRELIREFVRHDTFQLAASLSYYTLLSFAPLVLVVVALAGIVFERAAVEEQFVNQVRSLIGNAGGEVLQTIIQTKHEDAKGIALAIGLVTLFAGATTVFVQLQDALNRIWDVTTDRKHGALYRVVFSRILSFAMVISIGFLLLVSLLVSAGIAAAQAWFHSRLSIPQLVWQGVDLIVSFAIVAVLVGLVFKILPSTKIAWRDVWFGSIITSVLFTFGKWVIGEYLGRASIGSAYGAAGSVVVLMAWTYYAALIFFLGAMITRLARRPHPTSRAETALPS